MSAATLPVTEQTDMETEGKYRVLGPAAPNVLGIHFYDGAAKPGVHEVRFVKSGSLYEMQVSYAAQGSLKGFTSLGTFCFGARSTPVVLTDLVQKNDDLGCVPDEIRIIKRDESPVWDAYARNL